jgi:acylphosphatase
MTQMTLHAFIEGRVQGVFFRVATKDKADELDLGGWVRNLRDGRVEVYAVGGEDRLKAFHDWLHQGPPHAHVDAVQVEWGTSDSFDQHFKIKG